MRIGAKLTTVFGALMIFLVVSGLVAFLRISHIERKVVQLAEVQEPLGEAVLETEINVAATARSTARSAVRSNNSLTPFSITC